MKLYKYFFTLILITLPFTALHSEEYKKFYYFAAGNIQTGFKTIGNPLRYKPSVKLYALVYENEVGKRKSIKFFMEGILVERKKFNDNDDVIYIEGLSNYKRGAWFEAIYTYRQRGINFSRFIKEIDYTIYKTVLKRNKEVLYREITKFKLEKSGDKIWNVMYRRDFLPNNKLHHFWLFKYKTMASEQPYKILEYGLDGRLRRIGKYVKKNGRHVLVFKRANSR